MNTHCIPPRQTCAACRAEVRAAQMEEREWRRILWRCEVGFWIAAVVGVLAVAGGFILAMCLTPEGTSATALLPWLWLFILLGVVAIAGLAVSLPWCPWDHSTGPWSGDERESYLAAKVCREQHEKTLWEARVEILKAQEEARSEVEDRERG